jgi:hypothetical protein
LSGSSNATAIGFYPCPPEENKDMIGFTINVKKIFYKFKDKDKSIEQKSIENLTLEEWKDMELDNRKELFGFSGVIEDSDTSLSGIPAKKLISKVGTLKTMNI